MGGKKIEVRCPEDLKRMPDEELIPLAQIENDVIKNDCFNPLDILLREYAYSELERRGYRIREELVIERGEEE
ncbi:MAG: hypothetical protein JHC26_11820 [Thermofilum sp.]|jgi:hypothetical protein|uniref:hypothetical protein n=1 Tax=Thermofilum sp. TaxID=1961369 RepID=UPI00258F6C2E|nr:hypothetical protein [Thermofilum sp.]MCI4409771.1 hypothetical protein [Thermofilum sp.]